MWFMIYADISIPLWHSGVGIKDTGEIFSALRLCRVLLPHSHLNYLKGIEMPNWMLWLAQAGVWFPVGINLRNPSWCPQDQTTAEQRAERDPFHSLFKKTRSILVFPLAPRAARIPTGKVFQGKVSLCCILCSSAQSSPRSSLPLAPPWVTPPWWFQLTLEDFVLTLSSATGFQY